MRTKRTYATLAAGQRRGIKAEVQKAISRIQKAKAKKTIKRDEELLETGEGTTMTDLKMVIKDNGNLRKCNHLTCSAALLWELVDLVLVPV